jgi:hypothetical protein
MLTKQNYAAYFAVLLYSAWYRKFVAVAVSVLAHAVPLLLWLGFLRWYGLEYYNHEAAAYSQGTWLYQEFIYLNLLQMLKLLLDSGLKFLTMLANHYSLWVFLAFGGIGIVYARKTRIFSWLLLGSLCAGTTWFQCFAANRYRVYMVADISFWVFALASYFICDAVKKKWILYTILAGWLCINILWFVHFPWIHPYNQ